MRYEINSLNRAVFSARNVRGLCIFMSEYCEISVDIPKHEIKPVLRVNYTA